MKISKKDSYFIIKASLFYGVISMVFSFSGVLLADKTPLVNPLTHETFDIKEFPGHFLWGFAAASVTWRLKYALLGGTFAVLVDFDHIISVFQIQGISHMSHSIAFATISLVIMILFGKKDYILGAIALSSVLSHISFDLFDTDNKFPLFSPVYNSPVHFISGYSILFEIAAITIIGVVALLVRKNHSRAEKISH